MNFLTSQAVTMPTGPLPTMPALGPGSMKGYGGAYPSYAAAPASTYPSYAQVPTAGSLPMYSMPSVSVPRAPAVIAASRAPAVMAAGSYGLPMSTSALPANFSRSVVTQSPTYSTYSSTITSASPQLVTTAEGASLGGAAGNVVQAVDHNAAPSALAGAEDKVSSLFSSIGSLFHRGGGAKACPKTGKVSAAGAEHEGPAGQRLGVGSSVEVMQPGGDASLKGHIMKKLPGATDLYVVQCHTDPRNKQIHVSGTVLRPFSSYAPVVGSGVEALFEGTWYSGYVIAMPADDEEGRWTVQCHEDEVGRYTFCNDAAIRPLLSAEEKLTVQGAAAKEIFAAKQAKRDGRKQQKVQQKVTEAKSKVQVEKAKLQGDASFKQTFIDNGLGAFHSTFLEHGYDSAASVVDLNDDDLKNFGLKGGHISKFHQAFPRGSTFVLDNTELKSTSAGLGYRATKSLDDDAHNLARWGTEVVGVDQHDTWLKVGLRYLPMELNGCRTMYMKSEGPSAPKKAAGILGSAEGALEKAGETAMKAEAAVASVASGALHGLENMFHMGGGDTSTDEQGKSAAAAKSAAKASGGAPAEAAAAGDSAAPAPDAAASPKEGMLAKAEDAAMAAEGAVVGAAMAAEGAVAGAIGSMFHWGSSK